VTRSSKAIRISFGLILAASCLAWVAGLTANDLAVSRHPVWWAFLLALTLAVLVYWSFRLFRRSRCRTDTDSELQMRTIEALALAIEAKDDTTRKHLERVHFLAVEIGKEMGLRGDDLNALRTAAVLHDVGKLAVPEHIIAKPGKLTPEEFDKVKIHPIVGAEILQAARFPYPVVPIVRAHHERWDGTGYPDGIEGKRIPLGARILSAVNCLDALASDRQYRPALPLDEAMEMVAAEAGKSYDPRVVKVLERHYRKLADQIYAQQQSEPKRTGKYLGVNGTSPSGGFESSSVAPGQMVPRGRRLDYLSHIAAARQEVQLLLEMGQELGNSLSLEETLSVLDHRLRPMLGYDAIAVYICQDDNLVPGYVNGTNMSALSKLKIPAGEGLCGWVLQNKRPIINGNPCVEPGYSASAEDLEALASALVVPLESVEQPLGVLALYRREPEGFDKEDLRVLSAINPKLSVAVRNALQYRQAEQSAGTDALTALPNTRSLFLHLDSELARCRRIGSGLKVFVCDLDGFKQVNDRHGHLVGNSLLQEVARRFQGSCRRYDFVARMGGDEFVLILPGLEDDVISEKVRSLVAAVQDAGRKICGEQLVSASFGVASFPAHGADAEDLLAEADRRMYKAKHWGKVTAFDFVHPDGLQNLVSAVR